MFFSRGAILLLCVVCCYGAASRANVPASKEHPGKCFITKGSLGNLADLVLSVGESKPAEGCSQITCDGPSGDVFEVSSVSCGVVAAGDGCRKVENKNAVYPACCPKLVCQ